MSSPVERWLDSFMCKQYAKLFDGFGFQTLQSICQLQPGQLHSMGVPQDHCELILQNVQRLRRSMMGSVQQHQYGEGMSGHYGNRMAHGMQSMQYHEDGGQQRMSGMRMSYNSPVAGGSSNYGNHTQQSAMMPHQYSSHSSYSQHHQSMMNPPYKHQYPVSSNYTPQSQTDMGFPGKDMGFPTKEMGYPNKEMGYPNKEMGYPNKEMGYPSKEMGYPSKEMGYPSKEMGYPSKEIGYPSKEIGYPSKEIGYPSKEMGYPSKDMGYPTSIGAASSAHTAYTSRQHYTGQVQGSSGVGQSGMHQSHPHLQRGSSSQNPQEVANNILHMASSSYPSNNTVQVPLSKNRSAPYHVPPRSPVYNMPSQQESQHQQQHSMGSSGNQGQFVYPNSSPHHQQTSQLMRMSPISPASIMSSPHSHHSGQSMPNSSPCSQHSPNVGDMRSPSSEMGANVVRSQSTMMSNMPHTQSVSSPHRGQYQMTSPTNIPHQRMVSPIPVHEQLQVTVPSSVHGCAQPVYRDRMSMGSPAETHSKPSPQSNPYSSPGPHSVGQFSNISSPYTPGSKASLSSPKHSFQQQCPSSQQYLTELDQSLEGGSSRNGSKAPSNPLQSLQKLCMLPERQVVDPKSVVHDACAPSPPHTSEFPKNCDVDAGSLSSRRGDVTKTCESASSHDTQCVGEKSPLTEKESKTGDINSGASDIKQEDRNIETASGGTECQVDIEPEQMADKRETCSVEEQHSDSEKDSQLCSLSEGAKCQPKKMILLRATKDEFTKPDSNIECGDVAHEVGDKLNSSNPFTNQESEFDTSFKNKDKDESNTSKENTDSINEQEQCADQSFNEIETVGDIENQVTGDCSASDPQQCAQVDTISSNGYMAADYISDISDSDNDCQLIVRKDIKTYSKVDPLRNDLTSRIRGQSTGSLSDDFDNSDLEYEDHIGCDDIQADLGYIDDKDGNDVNEDAEEADVLTEIPAPRLNEVNSISNAHWKKSKLNHLQPYDNELDSNIVIPRTGNDNVCRNGLNKRKAKVNGIKRITEVIDLEEIEDSLPVETNGIVDISNGDGTLTVARSSRLNHRMRKTPLKYKDTSFFQGDFVFVDEEEEYNRIQKRKSRKSNAIDVNHNHRVEDSKKSKSNRKKEKQKSNANVGALKIESVAENKPQQNHCVKLKQKRLFKSSPIEKSSEEIIKSEEISKSDELGAENSISDKTAETNVEMGISVDSPIKADNETIEDPSRNIDVVMESAVKETAKTKSKTKNAKISAAPRSRSKTKSTSKTKRLNNNLKRVNNNLNGKKSNGKRESLKSFNGVKRTSSKRSELDTKKDDSVNDTEMIKKEELSLEEDQDDVIEIDGSSDSSKNEIRSTVDEHCVFDDLDIDEQDELGHSDEIVKLENGLDVRIEEDQEVICIDDTVVKIEDKKDIETVPVNSKKRKRLSNYNKEKSLNELKVNHNKTKSLNELKVNAKRTGASKKVAAKKKRKAFVDDDPDFDIGPSEKALTSMSMKHVDNLKKKKKIHDKWADFKGPMVRLNGAKTNPDRCIVINEPFDTSGSKKANSVTQNVTTSIQISHLPSDKSVLLPHNEAVESSEWSCVLCGKHSSYKFLGDLFGPYTVESQHDESSDYSSKPFPKRRSSEPQPSTSKVARSSKRVVNVSKEAELWREVWVHESCAVWSDGVFLIGPKIYGLQEAVRIASQTPCTHCHEMGAMIGCLNKGCQQKFHFSCVLETDCYLEDENFSLLCPKHKIKKLKQLEMSAVSSTIS